MLVGLGLEWEGGARAQEDAQVGCLGGEGEVEDVLGAWGCGELGTAGELPENLGGASSGTSGKPGGPKLEKIRVGEKPRREHKAQEPGREVALRDTCP